MNYLAHSLPYVFDDDALAPWRVAGTSLPDWLRVIDKRARVRKESLLALSEDVVADGRAAALREGAVRHHDDDHAFHRDDDFEALSHHTTARVRARFPHLRASVLGHVLTEMLLDAALMARAPTLLDRYYAAVDAIDAGVVTRFVSHASGRPVSNVDVLLDRFRRARFLADYQDDDGLLACVRGVWVRAGLGGVDDGVIDVIAAVRVDVDVLAGRVWERALG